MAKNIEDSSLTSLDQYIVAFKKVLSERHKNQWHMNDLTLAIYRLYGHPGIVTLSQSVGLTPSTLMSYARDSLLFPRSLQQKYAALPVRFFRIAYGATRQFPVGSVQSSLDFWLSHAHPSMTQDTYRWHVVQPLIDQLLLPHNPPLRKTFVLRRNALAEKAYQALTRSVTQFNTLHAPYFGTKFALCPQPLNE